MNGGKKVKTNLSQEREVQGIGQGKDGYGREERRGMGRKGKGMVGI